MLNSEELINKVKLYNFLKQEPIEITNYPDSHSEVEDGNHRFTLAQFAGIKNIPANKARVIKAGTPVVTYTNMFGKTFNLPYRTKKQYAEIVSFIKLFRQEDITLKRILSDYSVKMGQYVNEPKLRKELREAFGFSKSAIDSILSIH